MKPSNEVVIIFYIFASSSTTICIEVIESLWTFSIL